MKLASRRCLSVAPSLASLSATASRSLHLFLVRYVRAPVSSLLRFWVKASLYFTTRRAAPTAPTAPTAGPQRPRRILPPNRAQYLKGHHAAREPGPGPRPIAPTHGVGTGASTRLTWYVPRAAERAAPRPLPAPRSSPTHGPPEAFAGFFFARTTIYAQSP